MKLLKIFQTSDIHGNIFPTNYVEHKNHGLAKVSKLISERSIDCDHTLILDSGDVIQGNPLAFYVQKQNHVSPSIIEAFNLIGYDAITLGNHEFNYGLDYLKSHYINFKNDILCANIEGLPLETKPYKIFEYNNLKVAVIGLTTSYIPNWEQEVNIPGLKFMCPIETYTQYEQEMKDQADIIIVNYHGGFECDLEDNTTPTELDSGENVGSKLIATFDSIDILLTGHQHRLISQTINDTICMQPGNYGSFVSEIIIDLELKKIIANELISVDNFDADFKITNYFLQLNNDCNKYLDTTVSSLDKDLLIDDVADARLNSHPLLSFLGQAFTSYNYADFVSLSLFDSAVGFSKNITIRQVNLNYPFPNTLVKVKLTGLQMIEAIAQSLNYYTLINDQITINPNYINPKLKHYNYDMYWGVNYTAIIKQDENVICDVSVDGNQIDLEKDYTMLISNYRYNNREDFPIYNDVEFIEESQDDAVQIILDYLSNHEKIVVSNNCNYTIKK